ncbi:diphosphate--fructose-6-phosphate 1-phosphotransferase [Candidatus Synchoanobacter obligatus]|uniref:Pyrophosphate--fructose 6-phosphate 1-phosphotransferase n=1 Tax=Candidatus Synchoanobacter obligatus TaxID=2919597 RepID=A0ABT1L5R4_9GAMM|nr:diphosphate--fructose-6-phosphate 1-phosphotransferase [Candidatus Synchoanobacter obligatus]MCP8352522.1 diphosphate--fructose-6-phosphate 1-phosphotransferase [Candidatus Synchoanobacter obligatus]
MNTHHGNILFAHSGGVTSVVNTVAATIYRLAKAHQRKMFISPYGVDGMTQHTFIDGDGIAEDEWAKIHITPSSAFGTSRKPFDNSPKALERFFKNLQDLNIRTIFINGGNNSQIITQAIQEASEAYQYPLQCIGIPKTIDNDIHKTDTCPGFGSTAKYTATSVYEISLDLAAMCFSSTQVLIYEAMGRDTGWIAAASALAKKHPYAGPHIILLPEATFSIKSVIEKTRDILATHKHCVICLAEGIDDIDGLLSSAKHQYAYKSLHLSDILQKELAIKAHTVIPDYLQRSARHLSSHVDVMQTIALAEHAYLIAEKGKTGLMACIVRESTTPYTWHTSHIPLQDIAGKTRYLPSEFISQDQMFVSDACIDYLQPLIEGEEQTPYVAGVPDYSQFIYNNIAKKLEVLK